MWRWRQSGFALILLAGFGCEVAAPSTPAALLPTRLVGADWSLRFEAAGGSGYLKVRHRLGTTLAHPLQLLTHLLFGFAMGRPH